MLLFCPTCANLLVAQEGDRYQFVCSTCPYVHRITKLISHRKYTTLKELDDVLGGADAWKNVPTTEECCPKCSHQRAYFRQHQIRSADEPMTTFFKCCNVECGHNWRE